MTISPIILQAGMHQALDLILSPPILLLIAAITITGVVMGAVPGLGPLLAMALFLPFTFFLEPEIALLILAVLYGSTTFGGSIPAILLNIPGTVGSTATLLDGYPMTQRGDGTLALVVAAISSLIGAMTGLLILILLAPVLADIALSFGAPERFGLALLGLSIVAAVTRDALTKGMIAASLGVFVASVGLGPVRAIPRYTFDWIYLQAGLYIIPVMVGMFGLSQVLTISQEGSIIIRDDSFVGQSSGAILDGVKTVLRNWTEVVRGSLLGAVVGSIPGVGITAANFLSYLISMIRSDDPDSYGQGNPRGVMAAESANNGAAIGALVPAMALSIPGGASAAIFIAAMIIHGVTPGPSAFQGHLPYVIYFSIMISNVLFVLVGIFGAKYLVKLIKIPNPVLISIVTTFVMLGMLAGRNNINDVLIGVAFGFIGYAMVQYGYSLVPFVIGYILGPIAEDGFQQSIAIASGDYAIFVTRPVSLLLLVLAVIIFFAPIVVRLGRLGPDATH